jgi:hypothetical protein
MSYPFNTDAEDEPTMLSVLIALSIAIPFSLAWMIILAVGSRRNRLSPYVTTATPSLETRPVGMVLGNNHRDALEEGDRRADILQLANAVRRDRGYGADPVTSATDREMAS